jgi:hypothetical protein
MTTSLRFTGYGIDKVRIPLRPPYAHARARMSR